MRTDEAILDEIIKDGSVEVDEWPELLKRLLQRLDGIAHNSFPQRLIVPPPDIDILSAAPPQPSQFPPALSSESTLVSEPPEAAEATLETTTPPNHPPDDDTTTSKSAPAPPVPAFPSPPPVPEVLHDVTPPPGTLHPDDLSLLTNLSHILTTQFDIAPPYTVQRMAELLRDPTKHYKSLQKFLRALQRVLSVSSPVTAFPLPPSVVDATPNGSAFTLGSDESLGGALLSPIPWLTPSALTEDASVNPSSESGDSAINGISQGELLRHEQELNIVPSVQASPHDEHQTGALPPLGPEDVGPQPEGTVFPDPPRTPEEARSPPSVAGLVPVGMDTTMGEDKVEVEVQVEVNVEVEKEEKMDEKADEKEESPKEEKKDDMEVDVKEEEKVEEEKAKELEDKMQLDAASDGKAEAAQKEADS